NFLQYLERQMARTSADVNKPKSAPPEVEIAEAAEKIEDFVRVLEELSHSRYIGQPTYLSVGRALIRTLREDSNLGIFFHEDLLPLFDTADRRTLSRVMSRVTDRRSKRELGTLFVGLFKALHYADVAASSISRASSRRRTLVLFSRI